MTLRIAEWFGHYSTARDSRAKKDRAEEKCPFIETTCTKTFNDGSISGVCSVTDGKGRAVAICPNRLYARGHAFLGEIAAVAFGGTPEILHPRDVAGARHDGTKVVAFGKNFGSELKLPKRGGRGSYFVDWILARIGPEGVLAEFVAVEVQTIDTTGSYRPQVQGLRRGDEVLSESKAGLNWENVNKRILPQLIYKGHVLRRERLCTKGLFFVCPGPVYRRIQERLGGGLLRYENLQPGSIVFRWYDLQATQGGAYNLVFSDQFPTTVDQVATAFTSPTNLPEAGVYEEAIRSAIERYGTRS